ncbi:MAG: nucleotide sugar dehydrogenase [Acidobacteriota bacterium]|nr:nucleotide sugar dehydrogenase [Acidobacteriota bacterium]
MTLEDWIARVEQRHSRIGILGLGYVGLPLALEFSRSGFPVLGFDIDAAKVDRLRRAESYIVRIPPAEIAAALAQGFTATSDFARIAELDAVLICVPTPLQDHGHIPDMSYVEGTMAAIAPHLRAGQLVVLESTTYPGTTEELVVTAIELHGHTVLRNESGPDTPPDLPGILVAFSPEREDPGNSVVPRREIPKVIGGIDRRATAAACALYGAVFHQTVPVSSPAAAEMTKLLENIYRNVNIALVNEMKQLVTHLGVDIWEVIEAARTKPFGFQAFYPGPGVGGHCIPVDPFYLSWKAQQLGFSARFIELAGEINEAMPRLVVEAIESALARSADPKPLAGAAILILGVAYKRDVDDLRESPALVVIELLQRAGAQVEYNDPFFPEVGRGRHYRLHMRSTPLTEIPRFDCVAILTDHSIYNYKSIVDAAKLVVDSRNATRGLDSTKIVRC